MSIVIAKIKNDECFIMSDTKISKDIGDSTVVGENKIRFSPLSGIMKIQIIFPRICISFAGDIEDAKEIIHGFITQQPRDFEEMLFYFKKELKKRDSNTQFIAAFCDRIRPFLYKIDKDNIEAGNSFWIGDYKAFEDFQNYFHSDLYNKLPFKERNINAFEKLIAYSPVKTIGDFSINAFYSKEYVAFLYEDKVTSYRGSEVIKLIKNEAKYLDEGKLEDGSYMVSNLISDNVGKQAVALFFDQINFGLLYIPIKEDNLDLKGVPIKCKSRDDFKKIVWEKHGLNLIGIEFKNGVLNFDN